nr:bifunctional tRNA (5-methylaminomethyl-2-thiouridine)(34)-methyltransferase MnmD/FAD-dependent 5-carboxymethylaminomethyl-2-thiouridine(34) oxidoreductase MnmC [uncultured Campylobacter sp.]
MKPAEISFKEGVPYSKKYDDVYFSVDDPLGECEHVFASALEEIRSDTINVLETGFGTGLNFLFSAKKLLNSGKRLNFVSIEANPLCKNDLAKIYENLEISDRLADKFLALYPPLAQGFHRVNIAPNVTLTLCFYDVASALDELSFKANLIFLDGFAPKKNEAMWSDETIEKISRLSAWDAILRTYTACGAVKRALEKNGFKVSLLKGHGKKREMISARFGGDVGETHPVSAYFSRFDKSAVKSLKSALVVGGGIAGCIAAYKLKELGLEVTIAEKESELATNGSSNHCGILMPLITKPEVKLGRMHLNAFLQATRFYEANLGSDEMEICEVTDYAYDDKLVSRLKEWLKFDANNEVFDIDLNSIPYPKAVVKNGGNARPKRACNAVVKDIKKLFWCELIGFEITDNGRVTAKFKNETKIEADVLVLALGSESMEFFKDYEIPLSSVRGQVTHIKPALGPLPFSAKGYICKAVDGAQVIGATYDRNLFVKEARSSDDAKNLSDVGEFLKDKDVRIIGSNVGFRGYSGDRFPIIGRLYDEEFYKDEFKSLLWSKNKTQNEPKYVPNVYVTTAHGSRGLCTAVLGAELICDLIFDRPLCIEKSLFNELHSARFLIRRLKKGL